MARLRLPFRGSVRKSFLERNQVIIGLIGAALLLGGSALALMLSSGVFANQYKVTASFANAAGLKTGDDVTVAGLDAGSIGAVEIKRGYVDIELLVDSTVKLPADSRAEVNIETLMGKKSVGLIPGGSEEDLQNGDVIPIERTTTPIEILDINNISTELLDKSDAGALNEFIHSLTKITTDKRTQVTKLIRGFRDATTVVDIRSAELKRLIDSFDIVMKTFASRDETLVQLIDRLNVVLANLDERKQEIETLLRATDSASHETASLVRRNRARLDSTLDRLHTTLVVLNEHQTDLAATIGYLEDSVRGYSSVGYSQGVPNRWANIFVQSLGPAGIDAIAGRCGTFDEALDELLGDDPRYKCKDGEPVDENGLPLGPPVDVGSAPRNGGGDASPGGTAGRAGAPGGGTSGSEDLPGDVGNLLDSVTGGIGLSDALRSDL